MHWFAGNVSGVYERSAVLDFTLFDEHSEPMWSVRRAFTPRRDSILLTQTIACECCLWVLSLRQVRVPAVSLCSGHYGSV